MEKGRFYNGEFASDSYVFEHAKSLSDRGFLPEIDVAITADTIRRILDSREHLMKRRGDCDVMVPDGWGKYPTFYGAEVDLKRGIVSSVHLDMCVIDGRQLAIEAGRETQRRRHELGLDTV